MCEYVCPDWQTLQSIFMCNQSYLQSCAYLKKEFSVCLKSSIWKARFIIILNYICKLHLEDEKWKVMQRKYWEIQRGNS